METLLKKIKRIKMIAMDVDGVLTPGDITFVNGKEIKFWYAKDRIAFFILRRQKRIKTCWISGRKSSEVAERAKDLGIDAVYLGIKDKRQAWKEMLDKFGLEKEEAAYIGDDLVDLALITAAGFAAAPQDACPEIKEAADYVTSVPGGRGVFRETAELILKGQNLWNEVLTFYK